MTVAAFTLVVLVHASGGPALAMTAIDFPTRESCEAAAAKAREDLGPRFIRNVVTSCLKK